MEAFRNLSLTAKKWQSRWSYRERLMSAESHKNPQQTADSENAELQTSSDTNISTQTEDQELHGLGSMSE